MKSTAWYIKTTTITVLLFIETWLATVLITSFVENQNYLTLSWNYSLQVVVLMTMTLLTFSLTVGMWDKYLQYFLIPLPVSLGIFLGIIKYNSTYALIASILTYLLMVYDVLRSHSLAQQLLKFDPRTIMRFSTRGLLFIFSVLGGLLVILNANFSKTDLNLGKKIADITADPIRNAVNTQLKTTLDKELSPLGTAGLTGLDQQTQDILNQLGIDNIMPNQVSGSSFIDTSNLNIDINSLVEEQINTLIDPYKKFIHPLMALLVFGIFQFYSMLAYLMYSLTVGGVFALAKKTHLLKSEFVTVEKETLHF